MVERRGGLVVCIQAYYVTPQQGGFTNQLLAHTIEKVFQKY